jgi:hypothetical protein
MSSRSKSKGLDLVFTTWISFVDIYGSAPLDGNVEYNDSLSKFVL